MNTLTIRSSELLEVEDIARELVPQRVGRIVDGRINGVPWFMSIVGEARDIARRRRLARRKAA